MQINTNANKRKISSCRGAGLVMAGFLCTASFACIMIPGSQVIAGGKASQPEQEHSIRVISNDPVAAEVFCESLQATGYFHNVYCQSHMSADPTRDEKWLPVSDYSLRINAKVKDSSHDYLRNSAYSLLTITTLVMVSSSAETSFNLEFRDNRNIDNQKKSRSLNLKSRGRIGMWAVIPLYTGFAGTTLGTILNSYRLPERVRVNCFRALSDRQVSAPRDKPACKEYETFLRDSYSGVRLDFWQALQEFTASEAI